MDSVHGHAGIVRLAYQLISDFIVLAPLDQGRFGVTWAHWHVLHDTCIARYGPTGAIGVDCSKLSMYSFEQLRIGEQIRN